MYEARYWVRYPPGNFGADPDCFCVKDGWPEGTEKIFEKGVFKTFVVQALTGIDIEIPPLGASALEIRRLELQSNGAINGLGQFKNVEIIHEDAIPLNGLDLALFPHLRKLICTYEKGMEWIFSYPRLEDLCISGYLEIDCQKLGSLTNLRYAMFDGGLLKSLRGIGKCINLTEVAVFNLRSLEDLDDLQHVSRLSKLTLSALPKLKELNLRALKHLETLEVEKLPFAVDLSGICRLQDLKKISLNTVSFTGLDLDEVISMAKLESLKLPVTPLFDQKKLLEAAQRSNRIVKGIGTHGKYASIALEAKQ